MKNYPAESFDKKIFSRFVTIPLGHLAPGLLRVNYFKSVIHRQFPGTYTGSPDMTLIYIEKGRFTMKYGKEGLFPLRGGDLYFHPPLKGFRNTIDGFLPPYSRYLILFNLNRKPSGFPEKWISGIRRYIPRHPFVSQAGAEIASSFRKLFGLYGARKPGWDLEAVAHIQLLLTRVFTDPGIRVTRPSDHRTQRILAVIDGYLEAHPDFHIPIEALFRELGLDAKEVYGVFRREVGIRPGEYITRKRLDAAKRILMEGRSVTETAFSLGFASSQSFATVFRRHFGTSPSLYVSSFSRAEFTGHE